MRAKDEICERCGGNEIKAYRIVGWEVNDRGERIPVVQLITPNKPEALDAKRN